MRMRNLTDGTLYATEDLDTLLKEFGQFQEGGARIQLESGRYCSKDEIPLRVRLHGKKDDEAKHFYFRKEWTVERCKGEICAAFDISGADEVSKQTLYRLDYYGEPAWPVRKEKAGFAKNTVGSGDLLVLRSNQAMSMEEKLTLPVHVTATGFPEDCQFIGELTASREWKLDELKQAVVSMEYFQERETPVECIRIRDKLPTSYFGKIHRGAPNRTVKQLGIKSGNPIVVQLLDEPEELDDKTIVLLFAKRDVAARTYSDKVEHKFTWQKGDGNPTIQTLKTAARCVFGIKEGEHIEICKRIAHEFHWRHMDPNQTHEQTTGKKKKQKIQVKAANMDLRKLPYPLGPVQDGDIIGVREERDNADKQDDF